MVHFWNLKYFAMACIMLMAPPLGPQMCGSGQAWTYHSVCGCAGESPMGHSQRNREQWVGPYPSWGRIH